MTVSIPNYEYCPYYYCSDNMCVNECILVYITWNIEKRSFFNHSAIVQVITSVFFSKSYLEDKGLNPDDIYSVKYGSKLIQGYGIKPTTKLKFL